MGVIADSDDVDKCKFGIMDSSVQSRKDRSPAIKAFLSGIENQEDLGLSPYSRYIGSKPSVIQSVESIDNLDYETNLVMKNLPKFQRLCDVSVNAANKWLHRMI